MAWARGWTPARLRPGDVVLVQIEKQQSGVLEASLDQDPDTEGAFLALDANSGASARIRFIAPSCSGSAASPA